MDRNAAIQALVDRVTPKIQELFTQVSLASWEQNTTGSPEAAARMGALDSQLRILFSDPAVFAELRQLRAEGGATDPALNRQLESLYRYYLANQVSPEEIRETVERETELSQLFANFRSTYQGQQVADHVLIDVLQSERDNAKRQEAWLASKQIGAQSAPKIRELAKVRNRIARKLGFRDYFAMTLEIQEIDEQELLQTFERLRTTSDATYRAEKAALDGELAERFGVAPEAVMPWHYSDPFFQQAPQGAGGPDLDQYFAGRDTADTALAFYDNIGFEVRDILGRSDLYSRPGKNQHAFCTHIDRKGDVRVLCNLREDQTNTTTMLHELGHAVYDKYIDPGLPWLVREPAHSMTTEAIAQLMGRLTNNAYFLSRFVGVPEAEAQAAEAYLRQQERRNQLIFSRWGMVVALFERALYGDPDQDLGAVWWDLVTSLQLVRKPGGDRQNDWAAKIHIANYPVYYHNYVLGEMTASQLQAALVRDLGDKWLLADEASAWLWKRVFRPGNLLAWNERLAAATGEPLNPKYFVNQFVNR
jgi:peptidyl-dipeptidase A